MNTLLLQPTDVLFFRDGRPMSGSLAGHGAAWPLPTVTNAALHAALWRAGLAEIARVHQRKFGRERMADRAERFGSLTSAGPFPVCTNGAAPRWFFPAPADARCTPILDADGRQTGQGKTDVVCSPASPIAGSASSNPLPLAVASLQPPTKDKPAAWWSEGAWNAYLGTADRNRDAPAARLFTKNDSDFADTEAQIGIGIDPDRGTQDGERIYSALYLRLRDGWKLGIFAETAEKFEEPDRRGDRRDLVSELLTTDNTILIGGQQRICSAEIEKAVGRLPLPLGMTSDFKSATIVGMDGNQPKHLVKWVLLSPAIFPAIPDKTIDGRPMTPHSGGWRPNWIRDDSKFDAKERKYPVLLRAPAPPRELKTQSRDAYRALVRKKSPIDARLVAALVPKPIVVTGWALGDDRPGDDGQPLARAGAKPTLLAVPAGAVYYFEADSPEEAAKLAAALNWHGAGDGSEIRNRRSTLLGEKGFGLGVCGTWKFIPDD